MTGPIAASLGEDRLHLQHGPIDLIVTADPAPARGAAFRAAAGRFETVLAGLAADLPAHRSRLRPDTPAPADPVARIMYDAARPFCADAFLTPMIAVAGAVADTVRAAMVAAAPVNRACVNNGGDIAIHLAPGARFTAAISDDAGHDLGRVTVTGEDDIRGIATSGTRGRSLSFGIADSVTVLARDAATADVAATLIANAVDLPGHPMIERMPARDLDPDSDLGNCAVVTSVASLTHTECDRALGHGADTARAMLRAGHIIGAALFLGGRSRIIGTGVTTRAGHREISHA